MSKIEVGILGATGMVGQHFIKFLDGHPLFELAWLGASERSAGKRYTDAAKWHLGGGAPDSAARFLTRFHITHPNLVDVNGEITQALGFRGFPSTYIMDVHGRVRFSVVGGISEQTLAARLAQVVP